MSSKAVTLLPGNLERHVFELRQIITEPGNFSSWATNVVAASAKARGPWEDHERTIIPWLRLLHTNQGLWRPHPTRGTKHCQVQQVWRPRWCYPPPGTRELPVEIPLCKPCLFGQVFPNCWLKEKYALVSLWQRSARYFKRVVLCPICPYIICWVGGRVSNSGFGPPRAELSGSEAST